MLQVNFIMIYIILKISLLLKITKILNLFKEYNRLCDRKTLSVKEDLSKIRPYLKDINNLKKSDT